MPSQLQFPTVTSQSMTNPLFYREEETFGVLTTTTDPSFTACAVTGDISYTPNKIKLDVRQAGSYYKYTSQDAGSDYVATFPIHPLALGVLTYGTETPNDTSPTGTSAASVTFGVKYKQPLGTAQLHDAYLWMLGGKPNTTTLSVSARGLVEASMEWWFREIYLATDTSGLTGTPVFPTFGSITGPVLSNIDAGTLPFSLNGVPYPISDFAITWNNNLLRVPLVGSENGLSEDIKVGPIDVTGSFTVPVGADHEIEDIIHDFPEPDVNATMVFKTGVMELDITKIKLIGNDSPFAAQPSSIKQNAVTFSATSASLHT